MKKSGFLWFWDDFPRVCTVAWFFCMAAAVVLTALWQGAIFQWGAEHQVSFALGMSLLLILVAIGNFVPGIPNMPAPLVAGWACAAGLSVGWTTAFGLMVLIMATIGSIVGYGLGRATLNNMNDFLAEFELENSSQRRKARVFYRGSANPILWSRVGRNAALCGHVNLIAGEEQEEGILFCLMAGFGHFLWTLQYLAIGFTLGQVSEMWVYITEHPYLIVVQTVLTVSLTMLALFLWDRRRRHY